MTDLNHVVTWAGIGAIILLVIVKVKIVNKERRRYRQVSDRVDDILDDVNKEIRLGRLWPHGGGFSNWLRDKWR